MASFKYSAMGPDGRRQEGELEAADEAAAMEILRARSLLPLQLSQAAGRSAAAAGAQRRSITRRDIGHFTNQLAALLGAGLQLAKALQSLEEQSANLTMKELLADIYREVSSGAPFADALARHPKLFPSLYISMIEAGELSGVLDVALERLAAMLEKDEQFRSKLRGAMTYPAIMLVVVVLSVVVLMTFVIPKFAGVFKDMGAALPFPTRVVMHVSGFFAGYWWIIFPVAGLAVFGLVTAARTPAGSLLLDRLKVNSPGLGKLMRELLLSRFAGTMSTLLQSGVPLLSALNATRNVMDNQVVGQLIAGVGCDIRDGMAMSQALRNRPEFFPSLVAGMVGTGEQAGNIPEMLENIGAYYGKEADRKIAFMLSLLEPVIIVVMGVFIGFIIMSIILPILDMQSMVK